MTAFTIQQKVRFQHCDPAGIVFYPRYFEMANITVEEWFGQRLGLPFEIFHGEMAMAIPSVKMEVAFHAPSRQGDMLDFSLTPLRIGNASVTICTAAACQGEPRLTIHSTLVHTNKKAMRAEPWPDDLRARITQDIPQTADNAVRSHA